METVRVVDGDIKETHAYFDSREIPERLGLTFPAAVGQLENLVMGEVFWTRSTAVISTPTGCGFEHSSRYVRLVRWAWGTLGRVSNESSSGACGGRIRALE